MHFLSNEKRCPFVKIALFELTTLDYQHSHRPRPRIRFSVFPPWAETLAKFVSYLALCFASCFSSPGAEALRENCLRALLFVHLLTLLFFCFFLSPGAEALRGRLATSVYPFRVRLGLFCFV